MKTIRSAFVILSSLMISTLCVAADLTATQLSVGLPVEVMRWSAATIVAVDGQRVQIAFMDSSGWRVTEWVPMAQLRLPASLAPMATVSESTKPDIELNQPMRTDATASEVAPSVEYNVGESVDILWHDAWQDGSIIEIKDGKYRVSYVGINKSWDEWVTTTRLRKKMATTQP